MGVTGIGGFFFRAQDPEALRALMNRYYDTARGVLERHGGRVEKFVGDAVMAVFGIPVASEDDALRATRAAVELRDVVSAVVVDDEQAVLNQLSAQLTRSGSSCATARSAAVCRAPAPHSAWPRSAALPVPRRAAGAHRARP